MTSSSGLATSATPSSAALTVQTPEMLERYEAYVAPGAQLADQAALSRIGERWDLTAQPGDATQLD